LRSLNTAKLNDIYQKQVLGSRFFEKGDYYIRERARYVNSVKLLHDKLKKHGDPSKLKVLEIGGGQIVLLLKALFQCDAVIADVNGEYKQSLLDQHCGFHECDLLYDDLPYRGAFDVVILCEVIEHLPVPPHQILAKIRSWMKPGGTIFVTTPNLYRLRNIVRLTLGMRLFDHFYIPDRGSSIGHPFEYSAEHLTWQLTRGGFVDVEVSYRQLSLSGATFGARLARNLLSPLMIRRKFMDSLVATGVAPAA
jgi:2-polyprenyl-3-methyl-5-hydroxy-6-metoxy-1,4-benzoquinol methylase